MSVRRGLVYLALGAALSGAGARAAGPAQSTPAGASSRSGRQDVHVTLAARVVEQALDEWRFGEAKAALRELAARAPDAPETLYLEGYTRFLEGDYQGALHRLGTARELAPSDPAIKELEALAREAGDAIKGHKEERSGHFVVRYPPEDAVLVPYALKALESAYAALHADLGFSAEQLIHVDIYRSPSDLAAVSFLSQAEVARTGTIALCKWARLMVTSPRALAYGYPWLDSMSHELVHYAVSTLSRDKAPVWLQEGLAKFLERRWREPAGGRLQPAMEHLLAKALRGGKLISFEAMHPSMAKLPSAEDATLAFAEVANAVAYLHATGSMAALRSAIAKVAEGTDARQAAAQAAGVTWPEFERGWRAYMVAQKYKTYPAIDIPTKHIRKENAIAAKRRPNEDEALSPTEKQSAPFRYLRLGNMLLRRNRPAAAAVEYEKGAKASSGPSASPAAHWVFPVKLGRTYLALGDPDRALKAVTPAQSLYPDLPWPHLIAGQALLAKGQPRPAIAAFKSSLYMNPFDPAVHCGLAEAYSKLPAAEAPSRAEVEREQRTCRELAEGAAP